ncbi:LD-carboxypeptidase [Botrimarina sp.]|uniref:S66 peptidase family protein n=1 Tax=Botrimarina sp. TaxID=2795802 RepID=UPI0032EAA7E0
MSEPLKAPALCPGDTVAIVAPASSPKREQLDPAVAAWEAAGFRVRVGRDLCDPQDFLSADDDTRARELNAALRDPEVRAVVAVRGGYGLVRVLDRIDYAALAADPKVIAGYSDLSALHAAVWRRTGLVTFHSPNAIDLPASVSRNPADGETLLRLACGDAAEGVSTADAAHAGAVAASVNRPGVARGRLAGGNLAVIAGLVGTPWQVDLDGAIFAIEEIGEAPYRVDRYLAQFRLAGQLERVAGVAVGHFTDCGEGDPQELTRVLEHYLGGLGVPVLTGLPFGHAQPNQALAFGARYLLDAGRGELRRLEPAVGGRG